MQSADDIASQILAFSDAELASAPALDVSSREDRLLELDFIGVAIDAKRRIDVGRETTLPVAVAARADGERSWRFPLRTTCLIVACDPERNRVLVAPGLLSPKELESRYARTSAASAARLSADELEGEGAQIRWTDLAVRMDIPWEPGSWTMTAVYFDWVSNRVPVTLVGGSPPAPATSIPLEITPMPAPEPPELPTFRRHGETPPTPTNGLSFEAVQEAQGEQQRLRVWGAFRIAARPYSVVLDAEVVDGGESFRVGAIVPMTLLLAGADCRNSWTVELAVPVYGPSAKENQPIEGFFDLDALATGEIPELEPGEYVCYVVLDGILYGPRRVSV
jgi:hypothetical protein